MTQGPDIHRTHDPSPKAIDLHLLLPSTMLSLTWLVLDTCATALSCFDHDSQDRRPTSIHPIAMRHTHSLQHRYPSHCTLVCFVCFACLFTHPALFWMTDFPPASLSHDTALYLMAIDGHVFTLYIHNFLQIQSTVQCIKIPQTNRGHQQDCFYHRNRCAPFYVVPDPPWHLHMKQNFQNSAINKSNR